VAAPSIAVPGLTSLRAVVFAGELGPAQLLEVEEACRRVGIEIASRVAANEPLPTLGDASYLIVAGLPNGARAIQPSVAQLADAHADSRVVLLSSEPLVRPFVSLANGRIALLAQPHTAVGLARSLRQVLLREGQEQTIFETAKGIEGPNTRVLAHSATVGRFWFGTLSSVRTQADMRVGPAHSSRGKSGVAMGFSLDPEVPVPGDLLQQFADRRDDTSTPIEKRITSQKPVPKDYWLAYLDRDRGVWHVYSHGEGGEAWLLSPLRMPSAFYLSRVLRHRTSRYWCREAMVGDVLVIANGTPATEPVHVQTALAQSGAAYFEQVAATLRANMQQSQCLAIEVL
jgi:hypothetical protein